MSRLIDKLNRVRKEDPRPIGFMVNQSASEKSRMQLIALVTAESLSYLSASADAAVIAITRADDVDTLEEACQIKNGVPAGGWLKSANNTVLKKLLGAPCDFVAFPASAPASVTQKEKLGRVLEVDASLNEGLLRTANDLPVDAVLVSGEGEANNLTINRLMFIQRLIYLVNKPVLVPIPANLAGPDLQALWDMGVCGLVYEITDEKTGEKLAELRKAIDKLNPPAFRKKPKMIATLPRQQEGAPQPPPEEDGEEEEDE
jgi:hypothetical protein